MSVVVIGGNDCMATRYRDVCKAYNCKAKVFTQMPSDFEKKMGVPDLMVVFTNTCSHKMVNSVDRKSRKNDIPVAKIHSASVSALKSVLDRYCADVQSYPKLTYIFVQLLQKWKSSRKALDILKYV